MCLFPTVTSRSESEGRFCELDPNREKKNSLVRTSPGEHQGRSAGTVSRNVMKPKGQGKGQGMFPRLNIQVDVSAVVNRPSNS